MTEQAHFSQFAESIALALRKAEIPSGLTQEQTLHVATGIIGVYIDRFALHVIHELGWNNPAVLLEGILDFMPEEDDD